MSSRNMNIFDIEMMILLCIHHDVSVLFDTDGITLADGKHPAKSYTIAELLESRLSIKELIEQYVEKV